MIEQPPNSTSPLDSHWPIDLPNGPFTIYEGPVSTTSNGEEFSQNGAIVFDYAPFPVVKCKFEMDFLENLSFQPDLSLILENIDFESVQYRGNSGPGDGSRVEDDVEGSNYVSRYFFGDKFIVGNDRTLSDLRFQIVNFSQHVGREVVEYKNSSRSTRHRWTFDGWELVIDFLYDSQNSLASTYNKRGYIFTHVASLKRSDRKKFSYEEASLVLDSLKMFLSFWNGQRVGIALPVGLSEDGEPCMVNLTSSATDPAVLVLNWYSFTQSHHLEMLFEKFLSLYRDEEWKNVLDVAVGQYCESLSPGRYIRTSVMSACAGLETIVWKLVVKELKLYSDEKYEELKMGERIDAILNHIGVSSSSIKARDGKLVSWPEKVSDRKQSQSALVGAANGELKSSVVALCWARNRIAHPDKKSQLSNAMFDEALNLALGYLELLILYSLEFDGAYNDRIQSTGSATAPWKS